MSTTGAAKSGAATAVDETVDLAEEARLAARRRDRLISIASPIGLLIAWEVAARFGVIDVRFFPAPSTVLQTLWNLAVHDTLKDDVLISLQRIGFGFLLGAVPAIVIGIAMGLWRPIRAFVEPLIVATYPIPKTAL